MELITDGAKLLCLSPHPDDIEFGAGATLHLFQKRCHVRLLVFSDRSETRGEQYDERDQHRAAVRLGIPEEEVFFVDQLGLGVKRLPIRFFGTEENRDAIRHVVSEVVADFQPQLILVPSIHETMQDHASMGEEVTRVVRNNASILGYEVPKHNRSFRPNVFVDVREADLEAKVEALECYSEFTNRYYFESDVISSLARVRALDAGYLGYAEAFELYRMYCGPAV